MHETHGPDGQAVTSPDCHLGSAAVQLQLLDTIGTTLSGLQVLPAVATVQPSAAVKKPSEHSLLLLIWLHGRTDNSVQVALLPGLHTDLAPVAARQHRWQQLVQEELKCSVHGTQHGPPHNVL